MKQKKIRPNSKYKEEDEEEELFASDEQGILPETTKEQKEEEMEHGDKDADVYSDAGRENLSEDAEIEPWEEGFMEGAAGGGQLGKDALTGEPLMGIEDVVEIEINGKKYRFVDEDNAEEFRKKKEEDDDDDDEY